MPWPIKIFNVKHLKLVLIHLLNLVVFNSSHLVLLVVRLFALNDLFVASVTQSYFRNDFGANVCLLFEKLDISFQYLKHVSIYNLNSVIVDDF